MDFATVEELHTHYAAVKARISRAATVPPPEIRPLLVVKPAEPEPDEAPDLRSPLLAGAPLGRSRGLLEPVLQRHGITWKQVAGKVRVTAIVAARHECMWVLRHAGMSFPKIGRFMNRDHTTVLHGVRQHELRRST